MVLRLHVQRSFLHFELLCENQSQRGGVKCAEASARVVARKPGLLGQVEKGPVLVS